MRQILGKRVTKVLIALFAGLGLFMGGIAVATHDPFHHNLSGGALVSTKVATDTDGWGPSAPDVWQNVEGARVTVSVPSGKARLVNAHFNAESYCTADQWCSVRIVAKKAGSATVYELRPKSGLDFAFDAPNGDDEDWEGNSVHRSLRLSGGSWAVYVQGQINGAGSMYLDDFHFEVNVHTAS